MKNYEKGFHPMKNLSRKLLVSLFAFRAMLPSGAMAGEELPPHFVVLPEDRGEGKYEPEQLQQSLADQTAGASNRLNEILRSNSDVFDRLADQYPYAPQHKWKLSQLELELGFSMSGLIGVLTGKGSIGTKIYFQPQEQGRLASDGDKIPAEPADLTITNETSRADLDQQVEAIVRTVMATGKIDNEANLRHTVSTEATNFQTLMQNIVPSTRYGWQFAKYRLDISLGASGMVQPGLFVGGVIRLRFEWVPTPSFRLQEGIVLTPEQISLQRMVNTIAFQADQAASSKIN
jgi:hypothetical protein